MSIGSLNVSGHDKDVMVGGGVGLTVGPAVGGADGPEVGGIVGGRVVPAVGAVVGRGVGDIVGPRVGLTGSTGSTFDESSCSVPTIGISVGGCVGD